MTLWMSENFTPEEFHELLAQGLNDPSSQMLERMPAILRETLLYPYTTGLTFAQGQYISGGGWAGWTRCTRTCRRPLSRSSTRRSTRPARVRSRSMSPRTSPRALAPTGTWRSTTPSASSRPVSGSETRTRRMPPRRLAGWGGDRVLVLDGPGRCMGDVLATEWDTAADAAEFETSAGPVVEALDDPAALLPGGSDTGRWVVVASSDDVLEAVAGSLGLAG